MGTDPYFCRYFLGGAVSLLNIIGNFRVFLVADIAQELAIQAALNKAVIGFAVFLKRQAPGQASGCMARLQMGSEGGAAQ